MGREIKLPIPRFPDRLPFESTLEKTMMVVGKKIEAFPLVKAADALVNKLPYPAEGTLNTPFGSVRVPPLNLPRFKMPDMDERQMQALRASAGKDLAELIQMVPVVGPHIAEPIADTFAAKLHSSMTAEEYEEYKRWEKKSPLSAIATIQTFVKGKA